MIILIKFKINPELWARRGSVFTQIFINCSTLNIWSRNYAVRCWFALFYNLTLIAGRLRPKFQHWCSGSKVNQAVDTKKYEMKLMFSGFETNAVWWFFFYIHTFFCCCLFHYDFECFFFPFQFYSWSLLKFLVVPAFATLTCLSFIIDTFAVTC